MLIVTCWSKSGRNRRGGSTSRWRSRKGTFLRASTDRIAKVTLPSPSLFANVWHPERSRDAYPTLDDFLADVVAIFREEVQ